MSRSPAWTVAVILSLLARSALALPCGDLDVDADVDGDDAGILQQQLAELAALTAPQAERCDVVADGLNGRPATPECSIVDVAVMLRNESLLGPGVDEICAAAAGAAPDPASEVEISSDCLTLASGAQAAVLVTLLDLGGNPLAGATVTMMASAGSLGAVSSAGNAYWAILSPPLSGAGASISIEANGVPLDTSPTVSFAEPFLDLDGGAGGCAGDGNLRVTVVDQSGAPLSGANVLVGGGEQLDVFTTSFGAAPDGDNTALTDGFGVAEFRDFGGNLDGPLTVTAAAAGREYASFVEVDAADVLLPLAPLVPATPTSLYDGDVAPLPAPANNPIEFAAVIEDVSIDRLATFDVASLFGDNQCYSAGGTAGDLVVPGNIYLPEQCALTFIVCLQTLPEHDWSLELEGGERLLFALGGALPLALLTGGPLADVLPDAFDYLDDVGVTPVSVFPPAGATLTAGISQAFSAQNTSCSVSNAPVDADVFCMTGGDYDSGDFPAMTPGEGRLFLTGLDAGIALAGPASLVLSVSSLVDTGGFAGIEYVGGAISFWDEANLNAPPGSENGSTTVFDRSNSSFDGAGGAMTFDDFFPIRSLSRAARDFSLSPLPIGPNPAADYTRTTIEQVVTETYTACITDDSTREHRYRYWTVFAPGDADGFSLPVPPAGWPRAGLGGDLAGLVDVSGTPENDALVWSNATVYEGLNTFFDYDQLRLFDFRRYVTHTSTNEIPY